MNIHIDEHTNRIKVKIQYFKILPIRRTSNHLYFVWIIFDQISTC